MSTCRCGSATSTVDRCSCGVTEAFLAVEMNSSCRESAGVIIAPLTASSNWLQEEMFCDEFHLVDLRVFDNCKKVSTNVDHVFNLAADMGGMGFIQSNHSVIFYNNTMISFNMLEAARQTGVKRHARLMLLCPRLVWVCPSLCTVA
jgi:GDP-D-mannose 3',5'-epimerase